MSDFWYGFIAGLVTAAMMFTFLSNPEEAHAASNGYAPYPGQQQVDPAIVAPFADPAIKFALRTVTDRPNLCQSIRYYVADDLGVIQDGTPAGMRGGGCSIYMLRTWLEVFTDPGSATIDKLMGCATLAHEYEHAAYNMGHSDNTLDIMYWGTLSFVPPECGAAFPQEAMPIGDAESGTIVADDNLTPQITRKQAMRKARKRLHGKGWTIRALLDEYELGDNVVIVFAYRIRASRRVCKKSNCRKIRQAFTVRNY